MIDSYIALDLETTGLEPKKEKITEIAASSACARRRNLPTKRQ